MSQKEYSVSEAVRLVGVESHVLRYWEEELQVEIGRTSQGHRIYSEKNIETFRRVKELKEHGLQLRAIRVLLNKTDGDMEKVMLTEQMFEAGGMTDQMARTGGSGADPKDGKSGGTEDPKNGKSSSIADLDDRKGGGTADLKDGESGDADPEVEESGSGAGQESAPAPDVPPDEEKLPIGPGGTDPLYDVALSGQAQEETDHLGQFEEILRRLIYEVMEENSQKMEQAMCEALRREAREIFLQYQELIAEVAAAKETPAPRTGIFGALQRLFRKQT